MLILIHNRSRAGLASREVGDARERQAGIRVWRHVQLTPPRELVVCLLRE